MIIWCHEGTRIVRYGLYSAGKPKSHQEIKCPLERHDQPNSEFFIMLSVRRDLLGISYAIEGTGMYWRGWGKCGNGKWDLEEICLYSMNMERHATVAPNEKGSHWVVKDVIALLLFLILYWFLFSGWGKEEWQKVPTANKALERL